MKLLPLILALIANPALAKTKAEKLATTDAQQTFKEAKTASEQLMARGIESPTEFQHLRHQIESDLNEYCDSMKPYARLRKECVAVQKSITASLDNQEKLISKNGKEDKFLQALEKMEAFHSRYQDLRGVPIDGSKVDLNQLRSQRNALVKEIRAHCSTMQEKEQENHCLAVALRFDNSLADHEESLRNGAFNNPPPSKKLYRNTEPMLRCFLHTPKIRGSAEPYGISDASGRYRYEHLTKSEFGYAINLKLSALTKSTVNNSKSIRKRLNHPSSKQSYLFEIHPSHSCAQFGSPPPECRVESLSLSLAYENGSQPVQRVRASIPIIKDKPFDLSLALDEDEEQDFRFNCAIASKMRKGGWVYSDEAFEEK